MSITKDVLKQWLPIAGVTTAFCGLVYVAVQQSLRHSANDPQIQLAEDAATELGQGRAADAVVPATRVEMAQSLGSFVVVFDTTGRAIASSGFLHGQLPHLPAGVFDFVRQHAEERVTWQPEPGVRIASVVVRYGGPNPGFVLAGRSLREVERREAQVAFEAGAAWVGISTVSLLLVAFGRLLLSGENQHNRRAPSVA